MTDIAPELLEKVQESFEAETAGLREEIKSGVKSYEEAYDYAIKVGEALSRSFGVNITPEILPDGMMYYNIADKVVRPMLMAEYNLTSEAAVSAQRSVNKAAGIGIRPLEAEFDAEKAQGIIDRVSSQPFEEIKWILNEPVKTFSKNVVDQTLEKNVEFQGKSGLSPKIRRTALGDACEWCQAVAGTYSYPNVPKDVYRRHANCDCVVEYIDGGKIQDVHTKIKYASQAERDAAIQERISKAIQMRAEQNKDAKTLEQRKNIGIPNAGIKMIEAENPFKNPSTPLEIKQYDQSKHIVGGEKYNLYMQDHQYPPAYLTISTEEAQKLVEKYHGTGILKLDRKGNVIPSELIIDNDEPIGIAVNNLNGAIAETTCFKIHYSEEGTHVVPAYPSMKEYYKKAREEDGHNWMYRQKS